MENDNILRPNELACNELMATLNFTLPPSNLFTRFHPARIEGRSNAAKPIELPGSSQKFRGTSSILTMSNGVIERRMVFSKE